MAEPKTKLNPVSVADFINSIENEQVRQNCRMIIDLMQTAANYPPEMWGNNIIGFGKYRYVYANGKDAEWPLICFSPRKQNITLYNLAGIGENDELRTQLGKHTSGKGCLYIKRLSDVDLPTLEKLIRASVEYKQKNDSAI
jgi:hypothetical protein